LQLLRSRDPTSARNIDLNLRDHGVMGSRSRSTEQLFGIAIVRKGEIK
jgi:hypothetical protein